MLVRILWSKKKNCYRGSAACISFAFSHFNVKCAVLFLNVFVRLRYTADYILRNRRPTLGWCTGACGGKPVSRRCLYPRTCGICSSISLSISFCPLLSLLTQPYPSHSSLWMRTNRGGTPKLYILSLRCGLLVVFRWHSVGLSVEWAHLCYSTCFL